MVLLSILLPFTITNEIRSSQSTFPLTEWKTVNCLEIYSTSDGEYPRGQPVPSLPSSCVFTQVFRLRGKDKSLLPDSYSTCSSHVRHPYLERSSPFSVKFVWTLYKWVSLPTKPEAGTLSTSVSTTFSYTNTQCIPNVFFQCVQGSLIVL